jgi:hypothetical protein
MEDMTTEETYDWEITIEPDQTCVKPRLKVRDGYFPTDTDLQNAVETFGILREKLVTKGFKVAPIK